MFFLIGWIVFGWVVGSIASFFWPATKANRTQTILIGIAGSVAGGLFGAILLGTEYHPAGVVMSVVGAIACMWMWGRFNEAEK